MSALATSQREFLAAIFAEGEAPEPGLAVYRRTVFANLEGALAAAYPVVRRLVGDAFFGEVARRHALARPSASGDLGRYGDGFAAFLAAYGPARELDYLPGVARLEWALHESDGAADAPALDFGSLAVLDEDRRLALRFLLHPAVRLVRSRHPVLAIWEANQPGRDGTPDGPEGAVHVLVHRSGSAAKPQRIHAGQWAFLAAVDRGDTFEAAAAHLTDPEALGPALMAMAALGVFCGFEAPAAA